METKNAAIIGVSEGNGHPFSFSAIVNGYSASDFALAGWPVIESYLQRRDPADFGVPGLAITHAWTQERALTERLARACRIPHVVDRIEDLLGRVDAVILARDDHQHHHAMAMPFLEAGIPVFVDKPLTLEPAELRDFLPHLRSGRLFSVSAMRFATELDPVRANIEAWGEIVLVRAAGPKDWSKYGIHLVDAVIGILPDEPRSVLAIEARHESFSIAMESGTTVEIDMLGEAGRGFRLDIFGTKSSSTHEISDNFTMFRRTLVHFAESLRTGQPAAPPERTATAIKILAAGVRSRSEARRVSIDEF